MSNRTTNSSFFELYCSGKALPEDIDDFIDLWHKGKAGEGLSLHEYLGMTWEEYSIWVQSADALPRILKARRTKLPAGKALKKYPNNLKARHKTA